MSTPCGTVNYSKLVQPANAYYSISVIESLNSIYFKFEQPLNKFSDIVVIPNGSEIVYKLMQSSKTDSPIDVNLVGNSIY